MLNEQGKIQAVNRLLDLRKGISPFTLLKVSNAFRHMDDQEILEVLWSNPETLAQIKKILPTNSWEIIEIKETRKAEVIEPNLSWFKIQLKKISAGEEKIGREKKEIRKNDQ